jgi:hypothetical protein
MSRHVYYVKSNRHIDWKGKPADWEFFKVNEEIPFGAETRKMQHWETAREGDIIVGHSIYYKGPKGLPVHQPRITALGKVVKAKENGVVVIRKVLHLDSPIDLSSDVIESNSLENAEPYAKGSNRYTIARLKKEEYAQLQRLIIKANKSITPELKKLNLHWSQI